MLVDQIRAFAARAQTAGVDLQLAVYPDMVHVWHLMRVATPDAQRAIESLLESFGRRSAIQWHIRSRGLILQIEDPAPTKTMALDAEEILLLAANDEGARTRAEDRLRKLVGTV